MRAADESFLRRAIRLAMNGRGAVEPNPMVGCVIVKEDRIIGEGFHGRYGGPHAEPTALSACSEDPRGATAYVTLEPCCHLDKQTPPCVPRLIEAGIARCVIGCLDPNPKVNGRGLSMLRDAGIDVVGPCLEVECKQLIAPFIARSVLHRPYVTLKWAQTADGKIAGPGGQRLQISNERSMRAVHRLRARCDAVCVGINTVLSDDPLLTARNVAGSRPLLRCLLDRTLRTPLNSKLVRTAREVPVLIGCDPMHLQSSTGDALRSQGVKLLPMTLIDDFLKHLSGAHLLVEAGPTLARAFFHAKLADRVWIFSSKRSINDPSAPDAAALPGRYIETERIRLNDDGLREYLDQQSPLYFAPLPSADMQLEANGEKAS